MFQFYGIPPPEYSASRSALAPFHPPSNYASAPPSCRNLPPSQPHNSRDYLKASYQEPTPAYSREPPANQSNFLADVEVLPPPDVPTHSDLETSAQQPPPDVGTSSSSDQTSVQLPHETSEQLPPDVGTSSSSLDPTSVEQTLEPRCHQSHYISSTPPPPRLHRLHSASVSSSSSLPGSPNLGSNFRVLNLPNPFRKDLLKNSVQPNSELLKNSVQSSEPNSPSNSELPSISCTLDVQRDAENNHSGVAYDNLGFVSDLHV